MVTLPDGKSLLVLEGNDKIWKPQSYKSGDTSEKALQSYEETWKKEIDPKIKSAHKVQAKLKLSDDDWDKEIGIISNL